MQRVIVSPRPDFKKRNAELGFDFDDMDGTVYWTEDAAYEFRSSEVDELEAATAEIYRMCLSVAEKVVDEARDDASKKAFVDSWDRDDFSLYGRFDLAYNGTTPPKLLEFNAETPTSLVESAVIQWNWMRDRPEFKSKDQFNSLHEKLIAAWVRFAKLENPRRLHFIYGSESVEDFRTVEYLADTAQQAGIAVSILPIEEVGSNGVAYYDVEENVITHLFKLYPTEWMLAEDFGGTLTTARIKTIEPLWKHLIGSKLLLPKLWEAFPDHPNLLPCYFSQDSMPKMGWVAKPIWGREGQNVVIRLPGGVEDMTEGDYEDGGYVHQQYAELPRFGSSRMVIGSWIIDGEPAGIGCREDEGRILTNLSRYVPHYFV